MASHMKVKDVEGYLQGVTKQVERSADLREMLGDNLATSLQENARLDGWLSKGQRSKVPYLLSLVDEARYDPRVEGDAALLHRLATQRDVDSHLRRELKPTKQHQSYTDSPRRGSTSP